MILDLDVMEDRLVARYQEAVSAGLLKWAGLIGDAEDAKRMPKLPGVAVLHRRGALERPKTIDVIRQDGIMEWTVFAAGTNLRDRGIRSGRRGSTGAYHALQIAVKYGIGFHMTSDPASDAGYPLWLASWDLADIEQPAQRSMYELTFQHEMSIVEDGYED